LRVATEPRLSPDGAVAVATVQTVAPGFDGYRQALWLVPTDGSAPPRQLTVGARRDRHPRFSPDGHTLAFLSDRRPLLEEEPDRAVADGKERDDGTQVYVLPLDGGEARRLTDLPRGVESFEWSPDGTRLVVRSASRWATWDEDARRRGRARPGSDAAGSPPDSDYRFIDRLDYMLNGKGFTYDRVGHLWLVDVSTGAASRLTDGRVSDTEPAWSPDGRLIAFVANRRRDADLVERADIHVIDVETRTVTAITRGPRSVFSAPAWLPDGRTIASLGHRLEGRAGSRNDIWLFAVDGSDATPTGGRNLSARHDLMPRASATSDVTVGEAAPLIPSVDGRWLHFSAPIQGAYELWRIAVDDGRVERLTEGRHTVSNWHAVPAAGGGAGGRGAGAGRAAAGGAARDRTSPMRIVYLRSSTTEPPDLWVVDTVAGTRRTTSKPRRLSAFNEVVMAELDLREPVERHATVDGRDIQGWFIPAGKGRQPLVVEIHGGPHTLYGWSLLWEFQVLVAAGIGVFYCNPRGSEGYGEAFNDANHRDWGAGPMRDVLAGVDALVADGLADPDRLGVTGGSYGGYLTNWIVAHDQRFRAAMTCRCVSDMTTLFLTGDISGGDWAKIGFDATPWEDPAYFREISPITYASEIRTPLLIQHAERDLRTTIGQAEGLFTVLRSLHRPVRLLRVPEETHELTRSGTPFRRVENLRVVVDWFRHFLVDGRRGLPPLPKVRAGR
jgi:dipeptidyl aminopeptidase/acylaminoacyl peptidase